MGEKQDRLRRLLEVLITLQSAGPITLEGLRARFPEYDTAEPEAGRRKFERDKETLRELGLALETLEVDGDAVYRLDARASYLPRLRIADDDRRFLLMLADTFLADPAFPYRGALRQAVKKLGGGADPAAAPAAGRATPESRSSRAPEDGAGSVGAVLVHHPLGDTASVVEPRLDRLGAALIERRALRLTHRRPGAEATSRTVLPYGLFLKRGHWYLCGHDSRSEAIRVFRVSRIEAIEAVDAIDEGRATYEIPADFSLREHARLDPVHFTAHPPLAITVRVDEEVDHLAARRWGPSESGAPGLFRFETTYLPAVVRQVLELGRHAEIIDPPQARDAMRRAIEALIEVHGG